MKNHIEISLKSRDKDPVTPKTGSGALYLKLGEISISLLNEYVR